MIEDIVDLGKWIERKIRNGSPKDRRENLRKACISYAREHYPQYNDELLEILERDKEFLRS